MKRIILTLASILSLSCNGAVTFTQIGQMSNTAILQTNWLFLITVAPTPITGTNYNMTVGQFENWLATDPLFQNLLVTNISFNGNATNYPTQSTSPNVAFTNVIRYWSTNQSFSGSIDINPTPVLTARLMIVNSSALSNITYTLPQSMYSLSLGTNVTTAVVQTNSTLDLTFTYLNSTYYVEDYGKNNLYLQQISALNTNTGFLFLTNGAVQTK